MIVIAGFENGTNTPRASASRMSAFAVRSLTLPPGLRCSHLTSTLLGRPRATRDSSTSGVFPIASTRFISSRNIVDPANKSSEAQPPKDIDMCHVVIHDVSHRETRRRAEGKGDPHARAGEPRDRAAQARREPRHERVEPRA